MALVVIIFVGYFGYKKIFAAGVPTRYVISAVRRGTLVSSITGTGQVEAKQQVALQPEASGKVTRVYVTPGQKVKAGTLLVQIDAKDAVKSYNDAKINLESARLNLNKITRPDSLTLQQSNNQVVSAQSSLATANNDVVKAYNDAFTYMGNTFSDIPAINADFNSISFSSEVLSAQGTVAMDYKTRATASFGAASQSYNELLSSFRTLNRNSATSTIDAFIVSTQAMSKKYVDAFQSLSALVQFLSNQTGHSSPSLNTSTATLTTDLGKLTTSLGNLTTTINSIQAAKNSLDIAQRSLIEKQTSAATTLTGNPTDVRQAEITVMQRQGDLDQATINLGKYSVRSPFDGTVATVDVDPGDNASSGTSVATVISPNKIATISLNEIDVAKVKIGDKATLTLDALPDLSLTGSVIQVDQIGTVSQGVVTYNVKLALDTQDESVKPGMSVSASIITDSKTDVLILPQSAVKMTGTTANVQVLDNVTGPTDNQGIVSSAKPRSVPVEAGASNDSDIEIVSGLNEGDLVVTRTITTAATAQTTGNAGILGGSRTGSGNAVRIPR